VRLPSPQQPRFVATALYACWLGAALVIAGSLSACGASRSSTTAGAPPPARYPYTDADVSFMSGMIGHHAQAIVMAGWAPSHGAGASVQRLAERIVNAQQDEISLMQQWLRERGRPVNHEHHMLMPGMLSEGQMQELDRARGAEFDRLFLTFMIQHHRGAVSMVKDLFGTYGAAQDEAVFKFANDVNVDQSTEIARMESMLAAATTAERPLP
jgi:uncharacterized protein (DUF305 family)